MLTFEKEEAEQISKQTLSPSAGNGLQQLAKNAKTEVPLLHKHPQSG
jgi:hypothetical protein